MKVKELIKELEQFDGESDVYVFDREDGCHCGCIDLIKEIESYNIGKDGKPIGSFINKTMEEAKENTTAWDKAVYKDVVTIYADW